MRIEKIDPAPPDHSEKIASAYKKTFGGEPWNEGWKCAECGNILPLSFSKKFCPQCASQGRSIPLAEYWPIRQIVSDLRREMAKPGSRCLAAFEKTDVIGFVWGYEIEINEDTDAYLEAPGLRDLASGTYFYLDETAVIPERQGKGIGKQLVRQIILDQERNRIILRTLSGSKMFRIIEKMGGSPILNISRGRTIMTLDLLDLKTPR
jgi:GNAT superfamily N-acetyltransferase